MPSGEEGLGHVLLCKAAGESTAVPSVAPGLFLNRGPVSTSNGTGERGCWGCWIWEVIYRHRKMGTAGALCLGQPLPSADVKPSPSTPRRTTGHQTGALLATDFTHSGPQFWVTKDHPHQENALNNTHPVPLVARLRTTS